MKINLNEHDIQRRPDLAELALSCENTNTLIPYIDLANEPRQPDADCQKIDNAVTNKIIGDAVDCFENYMGEPNGGFSLQRTTYFHFPQGELVATGLTTAQPILAGSPGNTHIVGDIPAEWANNIVSGTKRFRGATGRVRLSGAINLGVEPNVFNCIFVIDLD